MNTPTIANGGLVFDPSQGKYVTREAQGFEQGFDAVAVPGDAAPVLNPAMPDEQFWYDENRRVREQAITNPEILAQTVLILSDKVAALEDHVTWLIQSRKL
jgi:hypothetical protein